MSLFAELKRRNVIRVGLAYVLMGWVLLQGADFLFDLVDAPNWVIQVLSIIVALGLPIALFIAWAFELTPEGIKREEDVDRSESIAPGTGRKLDRTIIVFLVVVVAMMAGERLYQGSDESAPDTPPAAAQTGVPTIAVLPLTNMSANPDNAFFAGGVHEDILTNLSRIPELDVVSRTTMLRYANSVQSLAEIGRELGAQFMVEGSVRRIDNHVRVTVQLIDTNSDTHLWANNYDRELIDVFATQSAIAKEISQSVQYVLNPESVSPLDDLPTYSVKAYDLLLQAQSLERGTPETEESLAATRALLEEAVQEDPDFVDAWGLLNETYDHSIRNILMNNWFGETEEAREEALHDLQSRARLALDKAVSLDPDNIETLLALASDYYAEQNVPGFEQERKKHLERALELYPDNAMAWYTMGYWYRLNGDIDNADIAFRKALELDPLNARILYGSTYHFDEMGNARMTALIEDRLTNSLGVSKPINQLINLRNQFMATTDDSHLFEMLLLIDRERDNFDNEMQRDFWLQNTYIMLGDLQAIAEMPALEIPAHDADNMFWDWYLSRESGRMIALEDIGQGEAAQALANTLLTRSDLAQRNPWADIAIASAYLLSGEADRAQALVDFMLGSMGDGYDAYGSFAIPMLSALDPERAADLLLRQFEKYPDLPIYDYIAMSCGWYPQLLAQPSVVDYYVEQGKWVQFLARCTPEYRSYVAP